MEEAVGFEWLNQKGMSPQLIRKVDVANIFGGSQHDDADAV